ncbi:hypothetical protein [Streptomyces sp. NPDC045470]|uniref:hypothetical protein n=1 Tax=Streptomyces sp. NPDC045470 TaxID=3155469 RepID=UPI00340F3A2C
MTEFRALSGAVTTWAAPVQPRRMKLSWTSMEKDDALFLDRLARRNIRGPLIVMDPTSANLLDDAAATADASGPANTWAVSAGGLAVNSATRQWEFTSPSGDAVVGWRRTSWGPGQNYFTAPGMRLSLAAPVAFPETTITMFTWRALDGRVLSQSRAVGKLLSAVAPDGAHSVTLACAPGPGTFSLAGACLAVDEDAVAGDPGDGCPAMSITDYSISPVRGPGRARDISLSLVEVANSAVQ